MARDSIKQLITSGVKRRLCHVLAEGDALPALRDRWEIMNNGSIVGHASSCAWSPKYNANLLFAMLSIDVSEPGTELTLMVDGKSVNAQVRNDSWQL